MSPKLRKEKNKKPLTLNSYVGGLKNKALITEVKALHSSIYDIECYGVRDLVLFDSMLGELGKRGYNISGKTKLYIRRSRNARDN